MAALEQYYRINEATGISIHVQADGNVAINACAIVVKDSRLDIVTKIIRADGLEKLAEKLSPKSPVAVNLTGRGVLHKRLDQTAEIDAASFSQVLPNANFADFYVQQFVSGDQSFVSVIRKADADKWIDRVRSAGMVPLLLSLGPFPIDFVLPQLNVYESDFGFYGHLISRNEAKQWTGYQPKPEITAECPLKLESEPIDEALLLPYADAFQLALSNRAKLIRANVDDLEQALHAKLTSQKFKVQGALILAVFFILLLANFVTLTWLNTTNNQLTEQVSRTTQSASDMESVNKQVIKKEALLQTLGWDGGIRKSKLADQLASLLPEGVSWKELTFNPIDASASQLQKQARFTNRRIQIVGSAQKIVPVNEWIARVKAQHWVKNIQLDSYAYNTELNTGQFTVLIDY